MKEEFKLVSRPRSPGDDAAFLRKENLLHALRFHSSFPMYAPTPLVNLDCSAESMGLGAIYVKDESKRFGLNAFKALGGSYAVGRILAQHLGKDISELDYAQLSSGETRSRLGELCFITATDGNHGRGLAWTATRFGHRSVVYMPAGSKSVRLENIRLAGADAQITTYNYDDTVRLARLHSEENGWILVQDTAWEGYEEIPAWIMQGYGTMGLEAVSQLPQRPTHIFLQAGVGSMAAAMAGLFADIYPDAPPKVIIVESNAADCIFRTAEASDGQLHFVGGEMNTIMAGLACGEPCSIAWKVLSQCADHFISCPDSAAKRGMRLLGNPLGSDEAITSGESGAACFGCLAEIMTSPELENIRCALGLDSSSRVLCFSTEGDTDPENYRSIVYGE